MKYISLFITLLFVSTFAAQFSQDTVYVRNKLKVKSDIKWYSRAFNKLLYLRSVDSLFDSTNISYTDTLTTFGSDITFDTGYGHLNGSVDTSFSVKLNYGAGQLLYLNSDTMIDTAHGIYNAGLDLFRLGASIAFDTLLDPVQVYAEKADQILYLSGGSTLPDRDSGASIMLSGVNSTAAGELKLSSAYSTGMKFYSPNFVFSQQGDDSLKITHSTDSGMVYETKKHEFVSSLGGVGTGMEVAGRRIHMKDTVFFWNDLMDSSGNRVLPYYSARSYTQLVDILATIGTSLSSVSIDDTIDLADSIYSPSNVDLRFTRKGFIKNSGFRICKMSQMPSFHVFDTSVNIVFDTSAISFPVNPLWWGARGDFNGSGSYTDNTSAFNHAFVCADRSNLTAYIPQGAYIVSGVLYVSCYVRGEYVGWPHASDWYGSYQWNFDTVFSQLSDGTTIIWDTTLADTATYLQPRDSIGWKKGGFENLKFVSMSDSTAGYKGGGGILIRVGAQSQDSTGRDNSWIEHRLLKHCVICNFNIGLHMDQAFYNYYDDLWFRGCRTAISIGGYGGSTINSFNNIVIEACGDSVYPMIDLKTTYGVHFTNLVTQATSWIQLGHCNGMTTFDRWYFEGQKNWYDSAMIKFADTVEYGTDLRVNLTISNVNAPVGTCGDIDIRGAVASQLRLVDVTMSSSRIIGDENAQLNRFGVVSTGAVSGILRINDHTGTLRTSSFGDQWTDGVVFGTNDRQGLRFRRAYQNNGTVISLNNEARSADSFSFTVDPLTPDLDSLFELYADTAGRALQAGDVFIHSTSDDIADGSLLALKIAALAAGDRFRIIMDSPQLQLRYGDGNDLRVIWTFGNDVSSTLAGNLEGRGVDYGDKGYQYSYDGEGPDLIFQGAAAGRIRYRTASGAHLFDGGPLIFGDASSIRHLQFPFTSVSETKGQSSDSLSDLDSGLSIYTIAEETGDPGINNVFVLSDVSAFTKITIIGHYDGGSAGVGFSLLHDDGNYYPMTMLESNSTTDTTANVRAFDNVSFHVNNCDDFIQGSQVSLKVYRDGSGNTSYRLYLQQMTVDR